MVESQMVSLGFLLIIIGFALIFIGSLTSSETDSKVAVGGFIGPIPFGFGNDPRLVLVAVALSVVMALLYFFN